MLCLALHEHEKLLARLAKTPELRRTTSDKVIVNLILATDRPKIKDGKAIKDPETGYPVKDTEFHRIVVFGNSGKAVSDHKQKGDQLAIQGRIHYSKWQDKEGNDRYSIEIIAENVEFI